MISAILGFLVVYVLIALVFSFIAEKELANYTFRGLSGGWLHTKMPPVIAVLYTIVGALSWVILLIAGYAAFSMMSDGPDLAALLLLLQNFFIGSLVATLAHIVSWSVYLLSSDLRRASTG